MRTESPLISVSREFGFDMGHCLPDHQGACHNAHGHRYRLVVTLDGEPILEPGNAEDGMVMDFARLRGIVDWLVIERLDHKFAVCDADTRYPAILAAFGAGSLVVLDRPPTAEFLAATIGGWITDRLPMLREVKLWETPSCSATWTPSA